MRNYRNFFISLAIIGACTGAAFADEFTPLNFSDATYTSTTTSSYSTIAAAQTSTETVSPVVAPTTGCKNMQSAISQLDNAQVEVRNELVKYRTQYAEVDAQYNAAKKERAELAKQVRSHEKKITQLDKAKEKIRKNME